MNVVHERNHCTLPQHYQIAALEPVPPVSLPQGKSINAKPAAETIVAAIGIRLPSITWSAVVLCANKWVSWDLMLMTRSDARIAAFSKFTVPNPHLLQLEA